MNKPREFSYGLNAKQKIFAGIKLLNDTTSVTLGPCGRNAAMHLGGQVVLISKDGITVAEQVHSKDKWEQMGVQIAREASDNCNEESGDGPQPLYSKVLTPKGFVTMGELNVGDDVCGTNGSIQKVLGVFPKGQKEIYELRLTDGRMVECCEDHLWTVTNRSGKKQTLTVRQMIDSGRIVIPDKNGYRVHDFYLPFVKVDFTQSNLPLDPYLVGVLLGDGSLSGTGNIELSLGKKKEHILDKIQLPTGVSFKKTLVEKKNYFRVTFEGQNILKEALQKLGLYGMRSGTKFIPKSYLYSSMESRKKLLRGLFDTDGYKNSRGLFEFSSVSTQLFQDIQELCLGIGMSLYTSLHVRDNDPDSYSDRSIHRMQQLKGNKYGYAIDSIEPTGRTTEMRCIKVSNPDNLYITDGYIVTHNTTSAVVMTYNMCKLGLHLPEDCNVIQVKEGMEKAAKACAEEIARISTPCKKKEDFKKVALISSQDEEIAQKVTDVFLQSGEHGAIDIEYAERAGMDIEHTDGFVMEKGWIMNHGGTVVLEDVPVLVTDKDIKYMQQILPVMDLLAKQGIKRLFIVCDNLSGEALGMLVNNINAGKFQACAVKVPSFGKYRIDIMRDVCAATGASFISEEENIRLDKVEIQHLGRARRVTIDKDKTVIVAHDSIEVKKRIEDKVVELEALLEKGELDDIAKMEVKKRLATLTDGVSIIKFGAQTEVERHEKKHRIEDAVRAVESARSEGITIGGGSTYLRCIPILKALTGETRDEQLGISIVEKSLRCITNRVLEVGGIEDKELIVSKIIEQGGNAGYDFKTGKVNDMIKIGIIEPSKVIRCVIQNATSCAKSFLSLELGVADADPEPLEKLGSSLKN